MTRKEIQEAAKQIVSDKQLIDRAVAAGNVNERDAMMARFGLKIRMKNVLQWDARLRQLEDGREDPLLEELRKIFTCPHVQEGLGRMANCEACQAS